MHIAFYAPLKSPEHPVPSGDRLMARQLVKALTLSGHSVELVSEMRVFLPNPDDTQSYDAVLATARAETVRIAALPKKPDLWFTYHPYYKSPDLLGPAMAAHFGIPYVTAEASYSPRRSSGIWAETQQRVADAVAGAAINLCFTVRDRAGLLNALPAAKLEMLAPFIDTAPFTEVASGTHLITLAMMRSGDKLASFVMLARALEHLGDREWTLNVIGDGPARGAVDDAFAHLPAHRITWLGEAAPDTVPKLLAEGGIYVWPGCGEAYGLAYLEAQAAGLPVIAQNTAGVPDVVCDGVTGILTPEGDVPAFAGAIAALLDDVERRNVMGAAARRFVTAERSLGAAAWRIDDLLGGLR
ncbi:glycosyltransferase [Mesorhizobium sp. NBSH29]|uniref:glycosyltransferase family 4 protein n=1 Tax=Mesorhizobium sp. NBSH29 TaxID=2654249 RepID=UPI0018966C20|nr:glycosyltransferase family 4 protein [Mesorhizobium sp. NBSH29]QPC88739.1 glycosyltransferase [Mesorhizobium sp. NBSH29]